MRMESDNVEVLFETNSIAKIEEIEAKLQKEIEKKKDDLKQIIGGKYKDLIDVSDGLQVMAQRCLVVVEEIDKLDASFDQFKSKVTELSSNRQQMTMSNVNRVNLMQWEFSIRCKIIVRSPSKIWFYLDTNDILSATFHYSVVQFVWDRLKDSFVDVKKCPNIVTQYANIVANFSDILINQAWQNVSYNNQSTPEPASIALNLTCIAILRSYDPSQLLEMFLETRYRQIFNSFENQFLNFETICLSLFGNLFDTCRLAYLVFVEDMGIPNHLTRLRDTVEKFHASLDLFCNQQLLSLVPSDIINFRLKSPFDDNELCKSKVKEMCNLWIQRINQHIIPLFSKSLIKVTSMVDLFAALKGANNLLEDPSRLLNWSDLNSILFDNEISVWDFFLRNAVLEVMSQLITSSVESAFSSLQSSIQSESSDLDETPLDVVWKSDTIEQNALNLKAFALKAENIQLCHPFEEQLKQISEQLTIIRDDYHQAFIPSKDLSSMQNVFISSLVDNLGSFLTNFEIVAIQENVDVLKIANIYRTLLYGCPRLKNCHFLFSKDQTDWKRSCNLLRDHYNQLFINFLDSNLTQLMLTFEQQMDLTSVTQFLDLCLTWEEITLEETLEDGKTIRSNIRIPMQISIPLYCFLKQLNMTINKITAHTMSRTTIITILGKLSLQLNNCYNQILPTILSKDTPKTLKDTQILQFYFDLSFLEQLLILTKDDNIKKDIKPLITESISNYQSQLDPFDLHVLQPHFQTSIFRCLKSTGLLFGNLIGQSTITYPSSSSASLLSTSVVKSETKSDSPNPMPSYSLAFKFPSLQKSKSKI